MENSKTVALRLSLEQYKAFKEMAEKNQSTVSYEIRKGLREYLEKVVAK